MDYWTAADALDDLANDPISTTLATTDDQTGTTY